MARQACSRSSIRSATPRAWPMRCERWPVIVDGVSMPRLMPCLAPALLTTSLLFCVEAVGFATSYARAFVTAAQACQLALLGVALAVVMAAPLAISVAVIRRAASARVSGWLGSAALGAVLQSVCMLGITLFVLVCQEGRVGRIPSLAQLAFAPLPALLVGFARVQWLTAATPWSRTCTRSCRS